MKSISEKLMTQVPADSISNIKYLPELAAARLIILKEVDKFIEQCTCSKVIKGIEQQDRSGT
jgi:hypothetical protein